MSFLPLFQQIVQGVSASNSGLLLLPMMIPIIVCSQLMGRVITKTGRYKSFPILGGLCPTAGSVLLSKTTVTTSQT